MRIKSRWHNKKRPKSITETAKTLGFNTWRIASETTRKLYNDGFDFKSNGQQLAAIGEILAFEIQLAGHAIYRHLDDQEQCREFIAVLAGKVVETLVENMVEELGPGEYRSRVVEKLNGRLGDYAEFDVTDQGQPGYPMLRYFGDCLDEVLGGGNNKWVKEQMIEVESPVIVNALNKSLHDLLGSLGEPEAAEIADGQPAEAN